MISLLSLFRTTLTQPVRMATPEGVQTWPTSSWWSNWRTLRSPFLRASPLLIVLVISSLISSTEKSSLNWLFQDEYSEEWWCLSTCSILNCDGLSWLGIIWLCQNNHDCHWLIHASILLVVFDRRDVLPVFYELSFLFGKLHHICPKIFLWILQVTFGISNGDLSSIFKR